MSSDADGLVRDWTFTPSPVALRVRMSRFARMTALRRPAPAHRVIAAATADRRWSVYFAFLPNGEASAAHLYTLTKLASEPGKLLVVVATPDPAAIPAAVRDAADALIWKGLGGFDFSAYAVALRHLADKSSGADVLVMNDSVFGPFTSPAQALADTAWDFAGFTASSLFENHVQSYAFQLRAATSERIAALALPHWSAFERYMDVVLCQETRLARHAAGAMTVGARWYAADRTLNPSLDRGVQLARHEGVPFLKRSLLGKHARFVVGDMTPVSILEAHGHPLP